MPLTIDQAKQAHAKYREKQKDDLRKQIDRALSKGHRSIISPNGAMFGEDIESVKAEYVALGWNVSEDEDFFTTIHFSETPAKDSKQNPRSIIDSVVGFFK